MSGYHSYKKRRAEREAAENDYCALIRKLFDDSRGTYGVDRICGKLRQLGCKASYCKVKRLMEEMGLKSIHIRRRQRSLTDSRKARGEGYPNLLKDLEITVPFQAVSSDISYTRTGEGFGYLCQIRDVVTNVVLAESMDDSMKSELVVRTIKQAMKRWPLSKGTIFHSDRGSQYTSRDVMDLLQSYEIKQSFSRVGKPGDNAWSESFFANMKKETVHWAAFQNNRRS